MHICVTRPQWIKQMVMDMMWCAIYISDKCPHIVLTATVWKNILNYTWSIHKVTVIEWRPFSNIDMGQHWLSKGFNWNKLLNKQLSDQWNTHVMSPLQMLSFTYCEISNISHTKSKTLNVSCLILQLTLLSQEWRCSFKQCQQAMLQLHLSDKQFYCLLMCTLY